MGKRLARYGLTLHPDKTRFVDFRNTASNGMTHPATDGTTFTFLGFTYPGKVTMPNIFFTQNPATLGVRKGVQAELLSRMNAGLAAVRADGTWQKINDRWLNR